MAQTSQQKVECKYCGEKYHRQGLFSHIRNSGDEKHGASGEVPEDFELSEELDPEPEHRNTIYMCNHCGRMCKGQRGFQIHLSKVEGDDLHPERSSIDNSNFTEIPADAEWNPLIDEDELTQLQAEIMAQVHDLSLYAGTDVEENEQEIEPEVQEMMDNVVIPQSATKPEQVRTVLEQIPELYNKPETVQELVSCSQTSFYKGRNLFDGEEENEIDGKLYISEEHEHGVMIDGEQYVPISTVKELVKGMNEVSSQLNEISTEGAKLIHRSR